MKISRRIIIYLLLILCALFLAIFVADIRITPAVITDAGWFDNLRAQTVFLQEQTVDLAILATQSFFKQTTTCSASLDTDACKKFGGEIGCVPGMSPGGGCSCVCPATSSERAKCDLWCKEGNQNNICSWSAGSSASSQCCCQDSSACVNQGEAIDPRGIYHCCAGLSIKKITDKNTYTCK